MSGFSKRLNELRTQKGLTQEALAKCIGVTRGTIGNYEQETREPDRETLETIADYFNVDIDYLLGRKEWTTSINSPKELHYNYATKTFDVETTYIEQVLKDSVLSKRLEEYAKKLIELKEMEDM